VESLKEILQTWGYFAVFLGSLVEGESVILTASIMAYFGYMSLPKIMVTAFIGTLVADQTLYMVGRHYGPGLIDRHPKLHAPAQRAFRLLHKWETAFILSFRFIYGIRTISPIVIGASGIPPRRFVPLNFLAAIIWTVVSCVGGYLLGDIIEELTFDILKKYFLIFTIGFVILIFAIVGFFKWRKNRKELSQENSHHD
jgi:membrane protein DedA with SNARE-associated domain